jgi:hypothetical protein
MFQLHGDMRDYAWGATGLDTIITQVSEFLNKVPEININKNNQLFKMILLLMN